MIPLPPSYVFGAKPFTVTCIPVGVTKWRARFRQEEWAVLFLKFPDRIEQRALVAISETEAKPSEWVMATNMRGVAA